MFGALLVIYSGLNPIKLMQLHHYTRFGNDLSIRPFNGSQAINE